MKIIIRVFIFCLVLFIYLHIQFHLKTSNDLEIFELDDPTKDKLEEVCDLRQPVVFNYTNEHFLNSTSFKHIVNNFYAFDIKIRSVKRPHDDNGELFLPLSLNGAVKLFNEDEQSSYYSENNKEFLQETGVIKHFSHNDGFFRPYMVSNCNYDILFGSVNSVTPFRYNHNYRNYFMVTQGSVQIKLAPPQSIKYLSPEYDYENFEFRSLIDVWAPDSKFKVDYDKVKFIDFTLQPGRTFFIPAYWWYSIKILEKNTLVSIFNYRTYMNNLAITPYFVLHGLQLLNVKRAIAKVNNDNHTVVDDDPLAGGPALEIELEEPKNAEKRVDDD